MNADEFCDRARARWKSDLVPGVRAWQAEMGDGYDSGVVDLDVKLQ